MKNLSNDSNGISILFSCGNGIYIPSRFYDYCLRNGDWKTDVKDLSELSGPDNENYWEVWDEVLQDAHYTDPQGNVWNLFQDGDLFAVCPELMTNEEYEGLFNEMKPDPEEWTSYEVCGNCLIACANDDYSGLTDYEEEIVREGLQGLHEEYDGKVVADGAEYGFRNDHCECCGDLPGNRYRLLCENRQEYPDAPQLLQRLQKEGLPWITVAPTISASHLTEASFKSLEGLWFYTLTSDCLEPDERIVADWAKKLGATWVHFDPDADVIEGLPTYEE